MSTKNIGALLAVAVLVGAGVMLYPKSSPSQTGGMANVASASLKFADQPYAQNAYLIDPASLHNMDAATKAALAGFMVTAQTEATDTTIVNFTSENTEYHDQSYTLHSGEKLYFIEKNLGDDQNGTEKFLRDDTAVVVDQNGNIVPQTK